MRETGNITFSLKRYGKVTTAYMIRMRISYKGRRIDLSTGFSLPDSSLWDATAGRIRGNGEINGELETLRLRAEGLLRYFGRLGRAPTPEEFRDLFHNPRGEGKDLFDCLALFVREAGAKNSWTEATIRKFRNLEDDLRAFRPNLHFDHLTESGLTELVCFWRDTRNLGHATVAGKLALLRWFLNWATDKGLNDNLGYRSFRASLKKPRTRVIFLTETELKQLQALVLPDHYRYLEKVRDVFLFCCFSGLRHSDAVNLRRSNIRGSTLELTTMKTDDPLSIELNGATRSILDKYAGTDLPEGRALPPLLNQTMNRDLKTLCRLAGIDESIQITVYKGNRRMDQVKPKYALIGTHTGRRTFIVNALSLGIPPNIVMKWTGHSDYKAMKPYIDIADSVKAREMAKMDRLFRATSGPGSEDDR